MRHLVLRLIGISSIYGLLLGTCLAALVLETEGESFPQTHHKAALLLGCFAICGVWVLLYQLAAALNSAASQR